MLFSIRPYRHTADCSVTHQANPFINTSALFLGFWSLITLVVLSNGPVYAEWVVVGGDDEIGMTVYMETDTIRREGDLVKVWELLDYKTTQTEVGISHLSVKVQFEYDCAEERHRVLAIRQYSNNMGRGKVVLSNSDEDKWIPVAPETIEQSLWTVACSNK